jgi:ABC-type antimicrobial peptide transport system permease subunit
MNRSGREHSRSSVAVGLAVLVGLHQGAVPLVLRGLFDRDQRFAPALSLPSPWWWIARVAIAATSLAVLTVAVGLLVAIDRDRQRHR